MVPALTRPKRLNEQFLREKNNIYTLSSVSVFTEKSWQTITTAEQKHIVSKMIKAKSKVDTITALRSGSYFDRFVLKNFNLWALVTLVVSLIGALCGIWVIPRAKFRTLLFGNIKLID